MTKFHNVDQSSGDDWAKRRQETGIWSQEDPEYSDAYFRQHSDSVWELPSTPFSMMVDLTLVDPAIRHEIASDLDLNEQEPLDELNVYAERLEGELQYLIINESRFETIEELPHSIKTFLDDLTFGDSLSPLVNAMGSRVNLWDIIQGEPETQQALADAGLMDEQGSIKLTSVFDSSSSLDELDKGDISMTNTIQTRVVDMKVKKLLEQRDQEKITRGRKRKKAIVAVVLIVAAAVIVIASK